MMMKHCGFTLMELMVVILIFLVISIAIFGVLSVGRQSWHIGTIQVQLQQEVRKAMDCIVKELRESGPSRANITAGGSIITFQVPVDIEPDGDVLDNAGNIEWGAEGNTGWSIRYLLGGANNRQLLRRVLDGSGNQVGADVILANSIRSDTPPPNALMFATTAVDPIGNPTVINIEITAQKDAIPNRTMQSNLYSQATLTNRN